MIYLYWHPTPKIVNNNCEYHIPFDLPQNQILFHCAHREIDSDSWKIKANLYCSYTFPVYLAPSRISLGAKSIGQI